VLYVQECPIYPDDYQELTRRLKSRGIFEHQPRFYSVQALAIVGLLGIGTAVLVVSDALWIRMLDAVLLAVVFVQLGFLFHDAGHRQIFRRAIHNDVAMLAIGFVIGSSRSWWFDSHNRHHTNPNELDLDPDTELYIVNFSERQAGTRGRVVGFLSRFQAFYFFPALLFEGVGAHIASCVFLLRGKARFGIIESAAMVLHFVLYFGLLFALMPAWQAVLFMVVHHSIAGLYMGSVFAPNHKGMLIPDESSDLDLFQRQVLTSRNVSPHPVTDVLYGGLNYQIEHHLFPQIPRSRLKSAYPVVKEYCRERGIAYYETSSWQSYREIFQHLKRVSQAARGAQLTDASLAFAKPSAIDQRS